MPFKMDQKETPKRRPGRPALSPSLKKASRARANAKYDKQKRKPTRVLRISPNIFSRFCTIRNEGGWTTDTLIDHLLSLYEGRTCERVVSSPSSTQDCCGESCEGQRAHQTGQYRWCCGGDKNAFSKYVYKRLPELTPDEVLRPASPADTDISGPLEEIEVVTESGEDSD